MVFGEIISAVQVTRSPVQVELASCNTIFQPVVSHIESLGAFHADLCLENIMCRRVVSFKGITSRRLWMAHFFKGSDDGNSLLAI
jgi:hypothetical protein